MEERGDKQLLSDPEHVEATEGVEGIESLFISELCWFKFRNIFDGIWFRHQYTKT